MKTPNVVQIFRLLAVMLLLTSVCFAQQAQNPQPAQNPQQPQNAQQVQKKQPTFWQRLLRFAGISATPSAQKAPGDEAVAGDIWLVEVNSSEALRLTHDGGYRSPIFLTGDKKIIAVKGPDVMEISVTGGEPKKLLCVKQVVKLVGANMDDPNSILVLIEDENRNPGLALLTLHDGGVTKIPPEGSEEYRKALTHAESWERVYGTTKVFVKTEVKNDLVGVVEWSDVYIKQAGSPPKNLSRCDGINCSQPSLSQSGRSVAFIKSGKQ
jgi:hypothetical protein